MSKIIQFQIKDLAHFSLMRLNAEEFVEYKKYAIPIQTSPPPFYILCGSEEYNFNLPRLYLALKMLTGESIRPSDNLMSSFEFPFLMRIKKEKKEFEYMLSISDYKGSFEFRFYKCSDDEDNSSKHFVAYQSPFDDEFSQKEFNKFLFYIYGYLWGYQKTALKHYDEPFLHIVGGVLFGYLNHKFFEEYYKDRVDYEKAVESKNKELEKEIGKKCKIPQKQKMTKIILEVPWEFRFLPYQQQVEIKKKLKQIVEVELPKS